MKYPLYTTSVGPIGPGSCRTIITSRNAFLASGSDPTELQKCVMRT